MILILFSCDSSSNSYTKIKGKKTSEIIDVLVRKGYSISTIAQDLSCRVEEVRIAQQLGDKVVSLAGKKRLCLFAYSVLYPSKLTQISLDSVCFLKKEYRNSELLNISLNQRRFLELKANSLFDERLKINVQSFLKERCEFFMNEEFGFFKDYFNMFRSWLLTKEQLSREWNRKIETVFDLKKLKENLFF